MITRHALLASPLAACLVVMSPACAQTPAAPAPAQHVSEPSRLDYLVLASFADTPSLLSMCAYPAAGQAVTDSGARP